MLPTFQRGVFTRTAEGRTYSIVSNSEIIPEVYSGETDLALIGSDKLGEERLKGLNYDYIGKLPCRFVLAARPYARLSGTLSVASSYPRAFADFVRTNKVDAKLTVVRKGKIEGLPARGLADAVFDITETGRSLAANKLEIVAEGQLIELCGLWRNGDVTGTVLDAYGYQASLDTIERRARNLRRGFTPETYTEKLLADENEQVKKLASESGELIREICRPDFDEDSFVGEAADLVYAAETACAAKDIDFRRVLNELARRNQGNI